LAEDLKGRDYLGDMGADGRMILQWMCRWRVWIVLIYLKTEISHGLFNTMINLWSPLKRPVHK
jgi:hypothetical protein